MSKQPTYTEMMLEMKNILQKGLEDVRHEIRGEYQKAIVPLIDEMGEIRETVIRIDERDKFSEKEKKELKEYVNDKVFWLRILGGVVTMGVFGTMYFVGGYFIIKIDEVSVIATRNEIVLSNLED